MPSSTAEAPLLEDYHVSAKEEGRWWRRLIDVREAKTQLLFALPMIVTSMSIYGVFLVSVMFTGHLGELELAGATLGNSWSIVTGVSLLMGLSGSLETLCGQAYGAKLYRMMGVYLQSSVMLSIFFSILLSVFWYYTDDVLIGLHQERDISKYAAVYLRHLIPGLFAFGAQQCLLRFLQTQTIFAPLVVCSVVPLIIHVGVAYVMVHVLDLGFIGAPISASIALWISFLMLVIYVKCSGKFKRTWQGFSTEAFQQLLPSLRLAIPSALMLCLECCACEILVILAGLLPDSEINTSLIAMCVNTEAVAFVLTIGLGAVVSTRVSNELGAGNIEKAKIAVFVILRLSIFLALAMSLLLGFGHNVWASLFSSSAGIIKGFAYLTPLLTVSIILDSAQGVLSGVARGSGWQHLAALTNLIAYYVIGTPLAILFAFKLSLHARGLWVGLICGLFCQASTLFVITLCTKWTKPNRSVIDMQINN